MVPDIEDAMNEDDAQNTILVTQLLDNSAFLADTPRGEKKLPTEGNDGRYHIEGRLSVAPQGNHQGPVQHY
jgi:hypothetical protein